ncbi:hypothetical protein [Treponema brennaborense]|uniref:N-acetyltransferase domain-containing protein n=1 Tax=Treponema brennaborense (strain DSM 12168 / CIP 105900 / DD5/3) TaxID=906968 RepID=F4LP56_TREBD|nr:hypothetical protein [Treponema brennaborense]AEE15932.1 hypothetical protein Trebr_0488 [Treponema brennaborense DSM 12168]
MLWIEILGYVSSFLVLISLSMKSLVKLRFLNALGSLFFALFGLVSRSYPTAFMNVCIVVIDIMYLYRLFNTKDKFDILQVKSDDPVFLFFCEKNREELDALFGFDALSRAQEAAFFFRNNDIAGLLAFTRTEGSGARICIDYVTPRYRDGAVGRHFFVKDLSFWHDRNIDELEIYAPAKEHIRYLEKMGFRQDNDPATWKKTL